MKSFKPITPSLRTRCILDKKELWKDQPYKPLTKGLLKTGGRNHQGQITVRHIGGGNKKTYRSINFQKSPLPEGIVTRLEYDPNRSASIALIQKDKSFSYILAAEGLKPGMEISPTLLQPGSIKTLKQFPIGSKVHNIESYPGSGSKFKRAAGTYAILITVTDTSATLAFSSTKKITISSSCLASFGKVSNPDHKNYVKGKAGVSRWLGKRPSVKGIAMNPIDHPHGGKTKRGFLPRTPWGKLTRGKK